MKSINIIMDLESGKAKLRHFCNIVFEKMCFQRTFSRIGSSESDVMNQIDEEDESSSRFNMSFYRVFWSCCVSFTFCMMMWVALANLFHISADAILLMDSKTSSSVFIAIPNAGVLYVAVVYNLFGLMSFTLWELRMYNNQLIDNVAHRVVRLGMMIFVMFFSAWNATIYQTGFSFAMGRLSVFLLMAIELAYHALLSIHLIRAKATDYVRNANFETNEEVENVEVEMNEKMRF
ncbi:unnamed protein product [Orchesella dallaii]|uniref:Transmembrane protein n=1 Tax=Orchesella dallaii TaxID=48710 RepID=A0ABP1Q847_9HEXA